MILDEYSINPFADEGQEIIWISVTELEVRENGKGSNRVHLAFRKPTLELAISERDIGDAGRSRGGMDNCQGRELGNRRQSCLKDMANV